MASKIQLRIFNIKSYSLAKEKDIFLEEEQVLLRASELLASEGKDPEEVFKAYKVLAQAYSELLNNAKFLTTVSDRFQEKLKLANIKLEKQAEDINEINLLLDLKNKLFVLPARKSPEGTVICIQMTQSCWNKTTTIT